LGLHGALNVFFRGLNLSLVGCIFDMARHHALHLAIAHRALERQQVRRPQPVAVALDAAIGNLRRHRLRWSLLLLAAEFLCWPPHRCGRLLNFVRA
jgi:hypothetical protein